MLDTQEISLSLFGHFCNSCILDICAYRHTWTCLCNDIFISVVPEQVPILTASNAQRDSVLLVWGPPLQANGILTGYLLQYQLSMYTQRF